MRTRAVGHIRDVRRLVVAMSRARLGLVREGENWIGGTESGREVNEMGEGMSIFCIHREVIRLTFLLVCLLSAVAFRELL